LGESLEDLTEDDFLQISQKAAVALAFSASILMPFILGIVVPLRTEVIPNIVFVYMALWSTIGPSVAIAFFNYEFPSLMGGLVGCVATGALVKFKIGLRKQQEEERKTTTDTSDRPMEELGEGKQETPISTSSVNDLNQHIEIGFDESITNPPSPNRSLAAGEMVSGDDGVSELHVHSLEPANQQQQQQQIQARPSQLHHQASSIASIFENSDVPMFTENPKDSVKDYDRILGPRKDWSEGYLREILQRTAPIWGVVLILILTRIPQVGIQKYLKQTTPSFTIYLGTWGTFRLSASLVFQLQNIFTYPLLNWSYALLYVPFVIPFVLVSILTMIFFRNDMKCSPWKIANTVLNRLKVPVIAVMGALCLVQLMIRVDNAAPAFILGTTLADWLEQGFIAISPLLGALGSFFSGSTTVSNLTFGSVQEIAAQSIGTSVTSMLALQCVGAAAGSAISLNNIIAACAVVGLDIGEGPIVIRTSKFVVLSTTIATVVMLALYFRFD
jgi:L-lactate permease